jgi:hypothetical protein
MSLQRRVRGADYAATVTGFCSAQKHVCGTDCTATVADRRRTYGDRKIQSAIDRHRGHVYVVEKHVCGADCTATVADRRRTYDDRTMQSATDRHHGHVSVVVVISATRTERLNLQRSQKILFS